MQQPNNEEDSPELGKGVIVERPDGFYWQDKVTDRLFGPFTNMHDAIDDMRFQSSSDEFEDPDDLEDVEQELGIADWVDPDTGELAEDTQHHFED